MTTTMFGKRLHWMLSLGLFAIGCNGNGARVASDADMAAHTWDAEVNRNAPSDVVVQTKDAQGKLDGEAVASPDGAGKDVLMPAEAGEGDTRRNADVPVYAATDGGVGMAADAARDAVGKDAGNGGEAGDALWSSVVGLCAGTELLSYPKYCRTVADCGPTGPVVCSVNAYDWGPGACPIPPSMQPCPAECKADKDCTAKAGGTCGTFTRTCPRCDGTVCRYPPPPCTSSPNSCATDQRCRTDGTCEVIPCNEGNACSEGYRCNVGSAKAVAQGCEPVPCTEGHACSTGWRCNPGSSHANVFGCELILCDAGTTCPADTRCNVGSPRADSLGCEYVPCNDGYTCPANAQCTVAAPPANNHGCTTTPCKSDGDCNCGFCVNGACYASPGTCQYPPV